MGTGAVATGLGGTSSGAAGVGNGPIACSEVHPCKTPPAPGPTIAPDGADTNVQAISKLYLGDADRNASPTAWQGYGFDVDGLIFPTATTTGHCKPYPGAKPADVIPDGPGGVDTIAGRSPHVNNHVDDSGSPGVGAAGDDVFVVGGARSRRFPRRRTVRDSSVGWIDFRSIASLSRG